MEFCRWIVRAGMGMETAKVHALVLGVKINFFGGEGQRRRAGAPSVPSCHKRSESVRWVAALYPLVWTVSAGWTGFYSNLDEKAVDPRLQLICSD